MKYSFILSLYICCSIIILGNSISNEVIIEICNILKYQD